MIAIIIFSGALLAFYRYSSNVIDAEQQDVDNLLLDAKLLSSYLVSAGYPEDWTTTNVSLIGLTDGETRLSKGKVEQFLNIASSDYAKSRRLLSTAYDYYVLFEDKDGEPLKIGSVAAIGKDYSAENPKNLIKIERFAFYNSSVIKLVVYVW